MYFGPLQVVALQNVPQWHVFIEVVRPHSAEYKNGADIRQTFDSCTAKHNAILLVN